MYHYARKSKAGKMSSFSAMETPSKTLTSLLVSHIENQGMKNLKPILKSLYFLICSLLSYEVSQSNFRNGAADNCFKLKLEDTGLLSSILCKELRKRLSWSSYCAALDPVGGLALLHVDMMDSMEELLLLLRCSVLMVRLHPYDKIFTEDFQDAVALLCRLSFQGTLTRKGCGLGRTSEVISAQSIYDSCTTSYSEDISAKSSDSYMSFLKLMLEVYLDEVFADRNFQECLAISGFVSSTRQNLSMCSIQIRSVLEVIAAHFLLSVSGEHALQSFTESLVWMEKQVLVTPEVSLTVALSLIKHPVVMCAPVLLHSHLISLMSEVIGVGAFPENTRLKVGCAKIYLSAFSDSVILYGKHISKVMTGSCIQLQKPGRNVQSSLEACFLSDIYDRVNFVLLDFDSAWRSQIDMFAKAISSCTADAISYIEMNIYIIDECCRVDVLSYMSSLITRVPLAETNEILLQRIKEMTMQDFCLLASILKLMSCSMLQAMCHLKEQVNCLEELSKHKDVFPDYSSIATILSCFAQCNLHLSIQVQQFIVDSLKPYPYDEVKLMFVHFAGLLSLCLVSGFKILVRGCLFVMLVLLNVLTSAEGSSESLRQSVALGTESPAHAFSVADITSVVTESSHTDAFGRNRNRKKTSSLRAATKFQRAKQQLLRGQTACEVSNEETCNGEAYLKYFTDDTEVIADLADFVECKSQKDYSSWLLGLEKYRFLKHKRLAKQRSMRKTKVCESVGSGTKRKGARNM